MNSDVKNSPIIYRPAIRQDARRIAELYAISSDGVSDYIWSKNSSPGDSLLDIGQQRYERRNTAFSFENCLIAETKGMVCATLLSYRIKADDDYVEDDPILKPFWLLEEPNSLYIAGIAVDIPYRKQGIGGTLMTMAEEKSRKLKLPKLSLIVFEANTIAYELYLRLGYKEVMRKAIVPHPLLHYTGDALLMVKPL